MLTLVCGSAVPMQLCFRRARQGVTRSAFATCPSRKSGRKGLLLPGRPLQRRPAKFATWSRLISSNG